MVLYFRINISPFLYWFIWHNKYQPYKNYSLYNIKISSINHLSNHYNFIHSQRFNLHIFPTKLSPTRSTTPTTTTQELKSHRLSFLSFDTELHESCRERRRPIQKFDRTQKPKKRIYKVARLQWIFQKLFLRPFRGPRRCRQRAPSTSSFLLHK